MAARKITWLVLMGAVIIPLAPTLVFDSVGTGQADVALHIRWLDTFARSLADGAWLPTWNDAANAGFGSFPFHVLGRTAYYLMTPWVWLTGKPWIAIKIGLVMFAVLGAWRAFVLSRLFFDARLSTLTAVLFVLGPYVSFENANLGMMQCAGLALMPWTIQRLIHVLDRPTLNHVAWFALSYALLILTHLLVAFVLGGTIVAVAAACAIDTRRFRPLLRTVFGILWALALSSFYWIFIVMGDEGRQAADQYVGVRDQWAHFIFSRGCWLIPDVAMPLCFLAAGVLGTWVWADRALRAALPSRLRSVWPGLLLTIGLGILIQTELMAWLWERSRFLCQVDHPLRFSAALQIPVILLLGGILYALCKGRFRSTANSRQRRVMWTTWILVVVANAGLGLLIPWYVYVGGRATVASVAPHNPSGEELLYLNPPTADVHQVLSNERDSTWQMRGEGLVEYRVDDWRPHDKRIRFKSRGGPLDLRVLYYEGWRLELDGRTYPVGPGAPYGQIRFEAPPGAHTARLTLVWPERCRWAGLVSVLSAVSCVVCCLRRTPSI